MVSDVPWASRMFDAVVGESGGKVDIVGECTLVDAGDSLDMLMLVPNMFGMGIK